VRDRPPDGDPGRVAYFALLGSTTLGTLSSNIINAPIDTIASDLGASASGMVLAVSAFTIAMVLAAPVAGWMSERWGAKRFLVWAMGLMVLAQIGASLSPGLTVLIAMRALQGTACSAIPPSVQRTLGTYWTRNRGRVMAAWASSVGAGQAVGPPLGGFITETVGWRGIFLVHASLSLVMIFLLVRHVPAVVAGRPPLHASGMTLLIAGVGSLVMAFTLAGQGASPGLELGLVVLGAVLLVLYGLLSRDSPRALVAPGLLTEVRYLRSTAAASTSMATMGVVLVTVSLFLGSELGLRPGIVGAIAFALAGAMTLFAPVSSRIAERVSPRRVLQYGLLTLVVGPALLAGVSTTMQGGPRLAALTACLVLIGCGIAATQSTAAFALMRSPAASQGSALGIHNMMRFTGMAVGYAWVAVTYPHGNLHLVYGGPAVLALGTLALTVLGGPAPPVDEDAPAPGRS
jgi:MFS family permease